MTVDARWVEEAARRTAKRTGFRAVIEADWPCPKCQYNLKGLKKPGACPECGTRYGESPIDSTVDALNYERPSAPQLRLLTPGMTTIVVGGWLLMAGLGAPIAFGLIPALAPAPESPARLGVLAALGVFGVPGAIAWLIGVWMLTLAPATRAGDEHAPSPGSLGARPIWLVWMARGCAPGLLAGVLGLCVALWPGLSDYAPMFSELAAVCLAVGCIGALPVAMLQTDLCRRVETEEPLFVLSFALWVVPAGGAGLALARLLPEWLGWIGSIAGGLGWLCGWFLVPMVVIWLWSLRPLRGTLARMLGVAAALEPLPTRTARRG